MTDRRSTRLLRFVLSLVTSAALLVGVPVLLAAAVGWPLPTSIPSIDSLVDGARTGISDQVVVNSLAVIGWVAWAQLALSFVVETAAVARGRRAIHLPVLPGVQVTAARLLAGILTITSTFQPMRVAAAPPPSPLVIEAAVEATAPPVPSLTAITLATPIEPSAVGATASTAVPDTQLPTVTVQRHDSYWAIAERTLNDGFRWREIHDLNVGRTLPDGTTILAGDDTLHTGWVLLLPADANDDRATSEPAVGVDETVPQTPAGTTVVERGDNLWTISEYHLEGDLGRDATDTEVAHYWQQVVATNQDRYVEPGNPDLILPGQVIDLPPTGHEPSASSDDAEPTPEPEVLPAPVEPPTADKPPEPESDPATTISTTPAATPAPESAHPDGANVAEEDAGSTNVVPLALTVGGLSSIALAVGLKRLIDRRRRRYVDEHDGQLPGRTPPEQRERHQAIIARADEEQIDDLQGVLGHLAATLAAGASARRPRMVRHAADSLEVLLDQPDTAAPAGWTASEDGTVWTLVEVPDPDDLYDGPLSPAPLMVTIGQPEDDAQLYLDLEADGLTALTGDPSVAMDLARSILTELTLSPLAETLRVIGIGAVVDEDAKILDHLTIVESWDDIAEDIEAWASQSHDAIADRDWPNAFIGRGHDPDHDALVPVAVIADRPPPQELADVLAANLPSTVAVVVVGDFESATAFLRCEPDALNFDMIDLACAPQALDGDELADLARIVVAADSPDEQLVMEELLAEYQALDASNGTTPSGEPHGHDPPTTQDKPPAADVLVRLLGNITVEGDRPLKPKATAVVAYLALHRSVSTESLEEACWFGSDGVSHIKRLHDTMTEARAAIGSQHLPANRNGTYIAGPHLRTDLQVFDWHVSRAASLDPAEAVAQYRSALDLVTGKPFTYANAARNSYGWVDFEHHATTWEQRVARIAQACSTLYLDLGEHSEAIEMLRRVAQAIPLNSAVVESLMRAHLAADDRAGAESVYKEHIAALDQAQLGEPTDSIEQLRMEAASAR